MSFVFEVWNWVFDLWFDLWVVLYWLSILFIFIRTCVDESKLCQGGIPQCSNHNDIKYCNATRWNQTSTTKWKPYWVIFIKGSHSSINLRYEEIFLAISGPSVFIICQFYFQNPENSNFFDILPFNSKFSVTNCTVDIYRYSVGTL